MSETSLPQEFDIPILFLNWIRADITEQTFAQIRSIKPKRLYIAFDGPRNEDERRLIEKTKSVINIDWDCEVKYLLREKNLGCKVAVAEAISWFFENEEMGIILEDDCYPDLSFFPYCRELLYKYKDDTRIMTISGYNGSNSDQKYSYRFEKGFCCWGWATWRRAWKYFDINMSDFVLFEEEKAINKYVVDVYDRIRLGHIFKLHASHNQSTWDWIFYYNIYCQNGLCISPYNNMIKNIGLYSELAAHEPCGQCCDTLKPMAFPLKHPHFIGPEPYYNNSNVFKSCIKLVIRKICRILSNVMPTKKLQSRLRNLME